MDCDRDKKAGYSLGMNHIGQIGIYAYVERRVAGPDVWPEGAPVDLAPGGGFVFAPIHVTQGAAPLENTMAWWETLQSYGVYG